LFYPNTFSPHRVEQALRRLIEAKRQKLFLKSSSLWKIMPYRLVEGDQSFKTLGFFSLQGKNIAWKMMQRFIKTFSAFVPHYSTPHPRREQYSNSLPRER
jgi:hypothetical protein